MSKAYLLAAGKGKRAGGAKAWRSVEGIPLLERQIQFLLQRFAPSEIAVSIQETWLSRCQSMDRQVAWIPVDPGLPPMAAVMALMKAAPPADWAFLHHVDMPVWEAGLWDVLEEEARRSHGFDAIVPSFRGKGGHPVLISPQAAKDILAVDPARDRLDLWLRARKVRHLEVPYPCALENWNSPAASRAA